MSSNEDRPCPVCGARAGEPLHQRSFVLPDGHPLALGYTVVTCGVCGAAYATPLPAQAAYDSFYRDTSKYADTTTGTGSGAQQWDDERLEQTARELASFTPDRNTHIVDIGCGAGGLLRWLAKLGFTNLTGIDPAPACADATDAIPGVRGRVGGLFALPAGIETAGLIVLSHVLEHVRDAGPAVDGLKAMSRGGTHVYAEVPDASRYADFLAAPFLDFNTEHINHFSVTTLRRLFASQGWTAVASGTKTIASSPTALYPCAWVIAELPERAEQVQEVAADGSLRMALSRYVTASHSLLARVVARCEELGIASKEIIVWGTGQTTAILLAETPLGGARIRAYTDSNPMHYCRTISGAPVVPPEALRATPELPIVIGTLLHAGDIPDAMKALNIKNPVKTHDPRSQSGSLRHAHAGAARRHRRSSPAAVRLRNDAAPPLRRMRWSEPSRAGVPWRRNYGAERPPRQSRTRRQRLTRLRGLCGFAADDHRIGQVKRDVVCAPLRLGDHGGDHRDGAPGRAARHRPGDDPLSSRARCTSDLGRPTCIIPVDAGSDDRRDDAEGFHAGSRIPRHWRAPVRRAVAGIAALARGRPVISRAPGSARRRGVISQLVERFGTRWSPDSTPRPDCDQSPARAGRLERSASGTHG